ncbi:MAG TPA: LysE family transporter, partial [Burkholderiaceae bacterium]|nr:LysE family transporter [Burkholderiaceae bacterium]
AAIVASAFSFSLLNPHVYLDTVVLLGAVGGQQIGPARIAFTAGAMAASTIWFFSLGYGARLLAPLFAKPMAWRVLDGLIALVMWMIAASLLV